MKIIKKNFGLSEFARRANIDRKTADKYLKLGIIKFACINPATGYRSFTQTQVDDYLNAMSGNARPVSIERMISLHNQ